MRFYTSLPVSYASLPVSYASLPASYASLPVSYASLPVSYASLPVVYSSLPAVYSSLPDVNSSSPPCRLLTIGRSYSPPTAVPPTYTHLKCRRHLVLLCTSASSIVLNVTIRAGGGGVA